jgi:hypothetical protein
VKLFANVSNLAFRRGVNALARPSKTKKVFEDSVISFATIPDNFISLLVFGDRVGANGASSNLLRCHESGGSPERYFEGTNCAHSAIRASLSLFRRLRRSSRPESTNIRCFCDPGVISFYIDSLDSEPYEIECQTWNRPDLVVESLAYLNGRDLVGSGIWEESATEPYPFRDPLMRFGFRNGRRLIAKLPDTFRVLPLKICVGSPKEPITAEFGSTVVLRDIPAALAPPRTKYIFGMAASGELHVLSSKGLIGCRHFLVEEAASQFRSQIHVRNLEDRSRILHTILVKQPYLHKFIGESHLKHSNCATSAKGQEGDSGHLFSQLRSALPSCNFEYHPLQNHLILLI